MVHGTACCNGRHRDCTADAASVELSSKMRDVFNRIVRQNMKRHDKLGNLKQAAGLHSPNSNIEKHVLRKQHARNRPPCRPEPQLPKNKGDTHHNDDV